VDFRSSRLETADVHEAQELYHARGWTDGLPVVPPTPSAVEACLEWAMLPAEHLVGVEPVRPRAITAEKLAVNAVMAGCLPMHFPVVVTAMTAMLQEEFLLHGATASTGGCAVLLIVNGPIRRELDMATGFNVMGNTDRSSAVIGRAIRLALINLLDVRPGEIDRSTLGHPGKFSYCIAEDEEDSPWPSLATERLGDPHVSAVTAAASMAPRQIMNEWTTDPREVCETIAGEMRANQLNYSIWSGNYVVVLPPQLRSVFSAAGWSKPDIQECVFSRAKVRRGDWAEVGKGSVVKDRADREYSALASPDDLLVVAAGGPAGGFASVIPPWLGTKSRASTVAVGACVDCEVT
jgi:hypothetical protein